MDMKPRSIRFVAAMSLVILFTTWSSAQLEYSALDPASRPWSVKQKSGLFDSTLRRINPADIDFGARLAESRAFLFDVTLANSYFWSNAVAIGLLVCLFTVIVFQNQTHARQDESTAEILVEYEHALSRAIEQAEFAARNNRSLKESLAALRESSLRAPVVAPDSVERSTSPPPKKERPPSVPAVAQENPGNGSAKVARERPAPTANATDKVNQMGLFASDADLIMRLNSLEQQLAQSQEDNKQLRRRITDGDRRLTAEQAKNRQLKGA